jgi:hypothetical protein
MKTTIAVGLLLLNVSLASGQFAYTVTFSGGYAMDGTLMKPLVLVRGDTYTFNLVSVPSFHPFKFTTSSTGGGGSPTYTNGITGTPASGTTTVTFDVTGDAPDVLYYQCNVHANLGARIDVKNPPSIQALSLAGGTVALAVTNLLGAATLVLLASDVAAPAWTTGAVFTATGPATNLTLAVDDLGRRSFFRLEASPP